MANLNISASISAADKATIQTGVNDLKALLPFLVNLDPKTRQRLRKKGTKMSGYVDNVFQAVNTNASVIPATFDTAEYAKDKVLFDDLSFVKDLFSALLEAVDDTRLAVGNELMKESDTCYDYLKRAAKDNASLTEVVNEIAKAFKHKPKPDGGVKP